LNDSDDEDLHDSRPWTSKPAFKGRGLKHHRKELEHLDLAWLHARHDSGQGDGRNDNLVPTNFLIALNESICRSFRCKKSSAVVLNSVCSLPCLNRNSLFYAFNRDRVVTPEEMAFTQGFGVQPIRSAFLTACRAVTDGELRDLLAETMSVPHIAAVLACVISVLPDVFETPPAANAD
jgi:hypothetical protein